MVSLLPVLRCFPGCPVALQLCFPCCSVALLLCCLVAPVGPVLCFPGWPAAFLPLLPCCPVARGGVLLYITYTGMCRPTRSWFWSSWRMGYPFQGRFLERGIIFRTHESSSFVSSHLKLFKDRLLLKIQFNALTSKLLYSCCTMGFSVHGGRILARAASAHSAILDK